jgi:hypothetical protein
MAHLGEDGLKKLANMSTGMDPIPQGCLCLACVKSRLKELPHNHPSRRGEYPLEFVHIDIAGPLPTIGHGGARYWAIFVDDFTGWTGIRALRAKSELAAAFLGWLNELERPERRCHRVRLDQAGENSSEDFKNTCSSRGIELEYTGTEQHQQNGVAEVTNRLVLERSHAILAQSQLPLHVWPFVVESVVYLRNLSPHSRHDKTPYEGWWGDKPDLRHIRTIGCVCYAKATGQRRKLVEDKTVPCRLLGFKGSSIYQLLRDDGTIILSSNVVFDEKFCNTQQCDPPALDLPTPSIPNQPGKRTTESPLHPAKRVRTATPSSETPPGFQADGGDAASQIFCLQPDTPIADATPRQRSASPEQEIQNHPELRHSTRANRGQYSADAIQRYEPVDHRYNLVFACLGAIMIATETAIIEPKSFKAAQRDAAMWSHWLSAMKMEVKSLEDNKTFTLVPRPGNCRVLGAKWVYKIKRGPTGNILRYKARWVVRGFEQKEGLDYQETFASVVKPMSYKALFAIAAALDLEIHQMDVKTAFLYGEIDGEVYVEQPEGLDDGTGRVCRLNKALYGLKQSPRIWYNTLSTFLASQGFTPLVSDLGVFTKGKVYIAIYVDDLLIAAPNLDEVNALKAALSRRFQMEDLGECHFYLGMEIVRDRPNRRLTLNQRGYTQKILGEFNMEGCNNRVTTPMTDNPLPAPKGYTAPEADRSWYACAIGSLMYLMLGTRPDIAYSVSCLSRFMANPTEQHKGAIKRLFRYLNSTQDLQLVYEGELQPLRAYTDADWAGDLGTRRSTSGYIFNLGSGAISWSSKRQPTVALSSCEAEYMGQTQAAKEAIWLQRLLGELLSQDPDPTIICGDNQGAIALAKNPQFHARTKHIDIQWHFVREKCTEDRITLDFVPTDQQIADGLTKPLPKPAFLRFRQALGLRAPPQALPH